MTPQRQLLEDSLAAFPDPARRHAGYLAALYAPSIVLHGYVGVEPGLASVTAFYDTLWSAFPDARVVLHDVVEQGDRLACRFTLTGTHQGEFLGVPATGRPIAMDGITILRFAGGQCVERWSQGDFPGLLTQLTSSA